MLQYEIGIIGAERVSRALAGIERRFVDHNVRMVRAATKPIQGLPQPRAGRQQEPSAIARGFSQIALAAKSHTEEAKRSARANKGLADSFTQIARAAEKAERAQFRAAAAARRDFRRRTGAVVSNALDSVAGVGKFGLAATSLAGGALIASKLGGAVSLEKAQKDLQIAGRGGEGRAVGFDEIKAKTKNTSIATGMNQEDIAGGMRAYVSATGNLGEAVDSIEMFAQTAAAAGANVADVATAAAYLKKNMNISAKEMPEALATLYAQGKKGAFELKDIAAAVPQLGAQAATLGQSGMGGLRTLGGLAQIAQQGTGNAAEAQTALSNLFTQITAKAGKLQSGEAFGKKVSVFEGNDPTKKMHDIRTVLADIIAASKGDVTKLEDFGEIRGSRALNPMVNAYKAASEATKGTDAQKAEAGRAAVLKMIADSADAGGNFADIQRDAADTLSTAAAQLEILNTKLTDITSGPLLDSLKKLGPPFEKLIPTIAKAVDMFASMMDKFAEHPITGIGAAIIAKVGYDIASAQIGDAIKTKLVDMIAGGGGPALPVGGGGGGAGGLLGAAGAGAGFMATTVRGRQVGAAGAGLAAVAGAAGMAAAYDQNEQLKKESGGMGAIDIMKGMWDQGTFDPFAVVDKHMSEQAKQAAAQRGGTPAAPAFETLDASAQAHMDAAKQLMDAAKELKNAKPGEGLNRSNSPAVPKGAG